MASVIGGPFFLVWELGWTATTFSVGFPELLWGLLNKSSRSIAIEIPEVGTSTCYWDFPRVLSTRTIASSMFISCSSVLNPAIRIFKLIYMYFCNSTFAILSLLFFRVVIIEPDLFRRSKIQPEAYLSNVMLPLLKSAKVDLVACYLYCGDWQIIYHWRPWFGVLNLTTFLRCQH